MIVLGISVSRPGFEKVHGFTGPEEGIYGSKLDKKFFKAGKGQVIDFSDVSKSFIFTLFCWADCQWNKFLPR